MTQCRGLAGEPLKHYGSGLAILSARPLRGLPVGLIAD